MEGGPVKRLSWLLFFIFLGGAWSQAGAYDYPLKDPYVATVIGMGRLQLSILLGPQTFITK